MELLAILKDNSNKKILEAYILINNKLEKEYSIVLSAIKRVLTADDKFDINFYSITLDFGEEIINHIQTIFQKLRIVGCLFHFIKQIKFQLLIKGLLKTDTKKAMKIY